MKEKIRVASGQGFWGDMLDAPVRQVEGGPIDYLMLDYLAEVTMSIMQKQRARDASAGYARDFVPLMRDILPACVERNIRVTANAGGVNPKGCAEAVREVARELGLAGRLSLATVTGDDIMERLDEMLGRGIELRNMETGEPLSAVRERIQSANVYLGAWPIVEALNRG
ncbi:MAG TPA: acyclic terpene utilization AtuA family protein, partial [Pyrinomonadaceae bacterium]|nr:acyclic terpene utilization AtuA family protein [Pyrinomonadaceae bacterium]